MQFLRSNPVFICCSATVANPREHSEAILGRETELIDKSGAPRGERTVILYNPPVVNRELGIRQSAMVPAREIAKSLVDNGIQTIIFATSRLNVEVLTKILKAGICTRGFRITAGHSEYRALVCPD
jgi:DEAD/DEAH box helicase domain-containing protein